jgi:hypothetical protein
MNAAHQQLRNYKKLFVADVNLWEWQDPKTTKWTAFSSEECKVFDAALKLGKDTEEWVPPRRGETTYQLDLTCFTRYRVSDESLLVPCSVRFRGEIPPFLVCLPPPSTPFSPPLPPPLHLPLFPSLSVRHSPSFPPFSFYTAASLTIKRIGSSGNGNTHPETGRRLQTATSSPRASRGK